MNRRTCGGLICVLSIFARGAAGALERPAFPAPSFFEGREIAKLGRNWRRENAGRCEPIPMLGRPRGDEIELSAERDLRCARTTMQVSCNCRASAIAGYRRRESPCHEVVIDNNDSIELLVFSSSAVRLKIIQSSSSVASCGGVSTRPHLHPCNFEL